MSKLGLFATFLLYALAIQSQTQTGIYHELIPYDNNNPFLSCTIAVIKGCWTVNQGATGALSSSFRSSNILAR